MYHQQPAYRSSVSSFWTRQTVKRRLTHYKQTV